MKKVYDRQVEIGVTYAQLLDLNAMWKQYILALLAGDKQSQPGWKVSVAAKIIKADLAGAHISVIKANNQSLVGLKGLVVKETARTFVIVAIDNAQKILLKKDAVFNVVLPIISESGSELSVNLWGDMLLYKGSERTKIKFKERGPLSQY